MRRHPVRITFKKRLSLSKRSILCSILITSSIPPRTLTDSLRLLLALSDLSGASLLFLTIVAGIQQLHCVRCELKNAISLLDVLLIQIPMNRKTVLKFGVDVFV